MNLRTLLILLPFAISFRVDAAEEDLVGKCTAVTDGDNITIVDENNLAHDVRLGAIDAPEGSQEFSKEARANLSKLVLGKNVRLQQTDVDNYGRLVGRVFLNDKNINLQQVRDGCAWRYVEFDKAGEYRDAEIEARRKKRGLWAAKSPIPPWEYVKKEREKAKAK
jgi:endonuclease YncB( thermonuclease family)